jgi:hypothetical protein
MKDAHAIHEEEHACSPSHAEEDVGGQEDAAAVPSLIPMWLQEWADEEVRTSVGGFGTDDGEGTATSW